MTDSPQPLTPERPDPTPVPAPTRPDPWSIWFSRLMQVAGLGLVVYEAVGENVDRPYLLLVAMGMMLGGLGLRMVLEWLTRKVGG